MPLVAKKGGEKGEEKCSAFEDSRKTDGNLESSSHQLQQIVVMAG